MAFEGKNWAFGRADAGNVSDETRELRDTIRVLKSREVDLVEEIEDLKQ